ncbi:hypothetical protein ACFSOZ_23150 [Mesorhizobium newzealandense]|uniref:Uncharacterized protein n=1 Tax=Mesorhizobium newzealandense TaxID=1300302 RepID=A0ABW4UGV7_9HYPH
MNRRELVIGGSLSAGLGAIGPARAADEDVAQTIATLQDADVVLEGAGASIEAKDAMADGLVAVAGISNGPISKRKIADEAIQMIVFFEVTSKNVYRRKYTGLVWPGDRSGVTCGIGYDIGYVTKERLRADWAGYISDKDIDNLSAACGVKGGKAGDLIPSMAPFDVDYDTAYRQFTEKGVPRYTGEVEDVLLNTQFLSAKSLGALVSLDYNRGSSFKVKPEKDLKGRYQEMRNIFTHMRNKEFDKIPAEIENMARLWEIPYVPGLITRRKLEAKLFREGRA